MPYPSPQNSPPLTTLFVTAASLIGVALSVTLLGHSSGGLGIGLLAVSGTTALASMLAYGMQLASSRRDNRELLRRYTAALDKLDQSPDGALGEIPRAFAAEARFRTANDPPVAGSAASGGDDALLDQIEGDSSNLWQRRPDDPDFVCARVGVGRVRPRFEVNLPDQATGMNLPARHRGFRQQHARASAIAKNYKWIDRAPITVPLREHAGVAIVAGKAHDQAVYGMAYSMIAQIALHHSPRDAHIVVLTAAHDPAPWRWAFGLAAGAGKLPSVIIGGPDERAQALDAVFGELSRRENQLKERTYDRQHVTPLPYLIIVQDELRPAPVIAPGERVSPVIDLVLRRGKELGATVLTLHHALADAPAGCTIAVDAGARSVIPLWPFPPAPTICETVDMLTDADCQRVAQLIARFEPEPDDEQALPTSVDLLALLSPPISAPLAYDVAAVWEGTRKSEHLARQQDKRSFALPLGKTASGQALTLDFINDGPHGLLIGQTGSGKSELLRSIIMGLATIYPPDMLNFILVDYKGGLGLDLYEQLPHTLALLTNLVQAGQTKRFLDMLESTVLDRQERIKRGETLPRLFVIIDEFAEMIARRGSNDASDVILDNLLRILRLGRQLDVHLLFASQRSEGSAIAKLRGYVQYRLCLRTNTEEDSKEMLGRPDAAFLPVSIPGRGYVLRGDQALTLFQAARVTLPVDEVARGAGEQARTADEIIVERMAGMPSVIETSRWPRSLPTPTVEQPTPLILAISGRFKPVSDAWNASARPTPPPMVAPLGLFDRPRERRQEWFLADLFGHEGRLQGGPLLVTGDFNAGKTTTLQTLLLYFALNYSPKQLRWYVIDPSGAFEDFVHLPHSHDLTHPEHMNIIGADEQEFLALKARFEEAMRLSPAHGRPPLLLIIDDYDDLAGRYGTTAKAQLQELAQKVMRGRERGQDHQVYLALSSTKLGFGQDALPQSLLGGMATKIVLYMSNRDTLASTLGGRVPFMPDPVPGRGFVQTRSSLDEIQVASPVYGAHDVERAKNLREALMGLQARAHS